MKQEEIKFSFWNYLPLGELSSSYAVNNWKKLGINLAMSFVFDPSSSKKQDMITLLDECYKNEIKVIIYDKRTIYSRLDEIEKEKFVEEIKEAYADFGNHSATYGFFIGDEPDFNHIDNFIFTAKTVLEIMPRLIPFGNLLPYWNDKEEAIKNGYSEQFYVDLVDKILSKSKLPLIGFDHYTQCYDNLMDQEKGIESFLYDLRMYQKVSSKYKIPFFASILALGHWHYRSPNEDDIRWQISTSFAHGARGILWFYFHQKCLDVGFGEAPFIGEKGFIGPTYEMILRQQNKFIDNYKLLLDNLSFKSIEYLNKENNFSFHSKEGIEISSSRSLLSYVSYFQHTENGNTYLMITNGSQIYSNNFKINYKNNLKKELWLLPGEATFVCINELLK